jgi:hypothetical protein
MKRTVTFNPDEVLLAVLDWNRLHEFLVPEKGETVVAKLITYGGNDDYSGEVELTTEADSEEKP